MSVIVAFPGYTHLLFKDLFWSHTKIRNCIDKVKVSKFVKYEIVVTFLYIQYSKHSVKGVSCDL